MVGGGHRVAAADTADIVWCRLACPPAVRVGAPADGRGA
jgi:hypothetical protein